MDLIATWDWFTWAIAVPLVLLVVWAGWRYVSAFAFRYVLLGGVLRRHGWQADLPGSGGALAAFRERERRRRGKAWGLLRQGPRGIREGYRTGVFGRAHSSNWLAVLTITGTYRGRPFVAEQSKRYEVNRSGDGNRYFTRRRSTLEVRLVEMLPDLSVKVGLFTGRVRGGQVPPELASWLRRHRFRFRSFRCGGPILTIGLGPRLRRGRLLGGLGYLSGIADRSQLSR